MGYLSRSGQYTRIYRLVTIWLTLGASLMRGAGSTDERTPAVRRAVTLVATLLGIASLIGPSTQALADPPPPPSESTARTELASLTVGTPHSMDGYSRDAFDVWADQPDGCTTR